MLKELMILFFCHTASAVIHSLICNFMISSGLPNAPEYLVILNLDNVLMAYYDTNMKTVEPRQHWLKEMKKEDLDTWENYMQNAPLYQYRLAEDTKSFFQQQTGGFHVIQQITGCEWDDETGGIHSFTIFGYNGEDFIIFDKDTKTWIASTPEAEIAKENFNGNKARTEEFKAYHKNDCPILLKKSFNYAKSVLHRTVLPSVSLLQKTPSSPVSCHATGFYPNRAMMFWRKDREEIHERVVHREMLPNQDGTFQIQIDLNISSVTPEDWRRYDCVFQLSGIKEDVVIGLKKSLIRTNCGTCKKSYEVIVLLVLIIIGAIGFTVYKKKKEQPPTSPPETDCELSERLNSETIQDPAHCATSS
ncbi:xenotropic and polytropic retrovirus receptor 1 [Sarotherodon galilaeus]